MFGCIFLLDRILRYVSVTTIAFGESAILGWRNLCVGCIGERCCFDCEVVEVVCGGEEWMLGDWYWSGACGGSLRCVVYIGAGWYRIVSQRLVYEF